MGMVIRVKEGYIKGRKGTCVYIENKSCRYLSKEEKLQVGKGVFEKKSTGMERFIREEEGCSRGRKVTGVYNETKDCRYLVKEE